MDNIFSLLQSLGIAGLIVGGAVWLIKRISEQLLFRDLEKFKADLERESFKFRTRFERLHGERAEVIKDIYKKLVKAQRSMHLLVQPFELTGEIPKQEKTKIAAEDANDFIFYYGENKIFLEESLVKEIDKLQKIFQDVWEGFQYAQYARDYDKDSVQKWHEAWKKISEEFPDAKKLIESKFRKILGIEED